MSATGVVIEPLADDADLEAILGIDAVSFTRPWTRAMYEEERRNPAHSFQLVARAHTRRTVGYVACWVIADELHINNVAVLPAARRQGVARALIEAALATGLERGAVRAWLEVRSANDAGRALYRSLGFAEVSVRRSYYESPPDDAIIMSVTIHPVGYNPAS